MRVALRVAYDGTNYHGWQLQKNGISIEAILNRELTKLLKEEIVVIGASRTDSGVHSLGNLAVFDTSTRIPPQKLSFALNQRLPEDIVIYDSIQVEDEFHPRRCPSTKTYEYRILNRKFPDPTRRNDTYFYYYPLDLQKMKEAARDLVGKHDFKSFCSIKTAAESTIREIYSIQVEKDNEVISIRISGGGFLYNMVRIIAGTLIKVGGGMIEPKKVKQILKACDRSKAGPTAPAHGLTMISINYETDIEKNNETSITRNDKTSIIENAKKT